MSDPRVEAAASEVRLIWHSDFYDGPLSGLAEWQGQRYWFKREYDSDELRLYALTPDELAHEEAVHEAFRTHVGTHCDYDGGQRAVGEGIQPRAEWMKFYDDPRWRRERRYDERPAAVVADYPSLAVLRSAAAGETE